MSHGHFVWFDLMTTAPAEGLAFYRELLGYGTESWKGGDMPYEMFTVDGSSIGGVMQLPAEAAAMGAVPHWLGYVSVPDCDATLKKVEALGGKAMHPPMDIPQVGRFCTVADPQGAVLALFQPSQEMTVPEGPKPGQVSWVELATHDHEAAMAFYGEVFGWRPTEAMDMGDGWIYQMFGTTRTMGGIFRKPPEMPMSAWLYYVYVDDVAAIIDKAKALGAALVSGPQEVPGGDLVAQLTDPQGAMFAIHGPGKKA